MPGFIATLPNQVVCGHGGTGQLAPFPAKVYVMGQPVVPLSAVYTIKFCSLASSATVPPCVTGTFTKGALKVLVANGPGQSPALIVPAMGTCMPQDQPRPLIAPPAGQMQVAAT
jgi:hypothetical protein